VKHRRDTDWGLERGALYVRYRSLSLSQHPQRGAVSIGIVIGPFRGVTALQRADAVWTWYKQVTDNYPAYWRACLDADIAMSHESGSGTEQWAPVQCHIMTPDQALPIVRDMARIRELFATAPAAAPVAQRVPVTLWDLFGDDDTVVDDYCDIDTQTEDIDD